MISKTLAIAGLAGIALTGCGATEDVTVVTDQSFEATVPAGTLDRCDYDDGTGAPCVWVADEQGNRTGTSFMVLEGYNGPFAYLTNDQARMLSK